MLGAALERPLSVITPLHFAFLRHSNPYFFLPLKEEKRSLYTIIIMFNAVVGFLSFEMVKNDSRTTI